VGQPLHQLVALDLLDVVLRVHPRWSSTPEFATDGRINSGGSLRTLRVDHIGIHFEGVDAEEA